MISNSNVFKLRKKIFTFLKPFRFSYVIPTKTDLLTLKFIIMKFNANTLSEKEIVSTTTSNKMKLAEGSESMIFQMFSSNIYSNPIGSLVREITSNCFDSHVEAGVNKPVLIKKTFDPQTDSHYISFIDFGVGMSEERIEKVYSTFFMSTKRDTNNQIGMFGLGSKTVLAYKRYSGLGEGEYDNSFFVITRYDGIEYHYNVYEGQEAPEYTLLHSQPTKEGNGTEIKVPVLSQDISSFEREIKRQLYYFENLVFEGFENLSNDYSIIEGDNFYFRGAEIDNNMHVCMGKVYYPLDFESLNLNKWDYQYPVAIKVPIGAVNVTVSRENLDYSQQTIVYLRKRIEEVLEELNLRMSKQFDNVLSLEDYFKSKLNTKLLYFDAERAIKFERNDIKYSNFKYLKYIKGLSNTGNLFELFFTSKMYGKKLGVYDNKGSFGGNYNSLIDNSGNLYHYDELYTRTTLRRIKQSYLKSEHKRYYIISKNDVKSFTFYEKTMQVFKDHHFDTIEDFHKSHLFKTLVKIQEEYFDIVKRYSKDYETLEVPEDYVDTYQNRNKLSDKVKNSTINVHFANRGRERMSLKDLIEFNGRIFIASMDEKDRLRDLYSKFVKLFDENHIVKYYSSWSGKSQYKKKSVMFIALSKTNMKYIEHFKSAHTCEEFDYIYTRRKIDSIINSKRIAKIVNSFNGVNNLYTSNLMSKISPTIHKRMTEIKDYISNNKTIDVNYMGDLKDFILKYSNVDIDNVQPTQLEETYIKFLNKMLDIQDKNNEVMNYIDIPSRITYYDRYDDSDEKILIPLLKNVLTLK